MRKCTYLLGLSLVAVLYLPFAATAAERPNIIVIFTDDHGFADLSAQDVVDDIRTPHIDALAKSGARMTSGYVTAPQCVPSRAGLLSGLYQNRFGVESNKQPLDGFNRQRTIAERLKAAGYATGMTGKWHLGPPNQITSHGFDEVYYKNANRPGWANFDLEGKPREPGPENSTRYHLDVNSAAACAFIERHRDEPFFFYCAYRAPHVPLDAPPKYLKRFPGEMPERRRQALAMLSAVDDGVGRIVATLKRLQLEQNTLVFLIGDNGAPLKIHKLDAPGGGPGWDGSLNDPLNGEKGMLSEGGIRVPFVASWPGRIPSGLVYEQPVISLDVALAGLPTDPALDGVNLLPHLRDETDRPPHETLYWRWVAQAAVREGRWKYLRGGKREYLFDLNNDAEEKHNLLAKHPDIARRLEGKLKKWSQQLQPPGLETKSMASTWEQYFDFYLDGKPAPPIPSRRSTNHDTDPRFEGWVLRNAGAESGGQGLRVIAGPKPDGKVFLACSGLKLPPKTTLRVRLANAPEIDQPLIATWRTADQRDFVADQSVKADVDREGVVQLPLGNAKNVVHVRLILPPGITQIATIEALNEAKIPVRQWRFQVRP